MPMTNIKTLHENLIFLNWELTYCLLGISPTWSITFSPTENNMIGS